MSCCCELSNKPFFNSFIITGEGIHLKDAAHLKGFHCSEQEWEKNFARVNVAIVSWKNQNSPGILKLHDIHKTLHHLQSATSYHILL